MPSVNSHVMAAAAALVKNVGCQRASSDEVSPLDFKRQVKRVTWHPSLDGGQVEDERAARVRTWKGESCFAWIACMTSGKRFGRHLRKQVLHLCVCGSADEDIDDMHIMLRC